ncbi:MAG TPA: spermidine synthase [Polyangia bacterium]|nr:spermidine synthase [Polyangia bacterium]
MPERELIDRQVEDGAVTVELHRRGEAYEVVLDGRRVVASDVRRSERSLVELAMAPLRGRDDITVLLAGLGMGFTLRAVLDTPGVTRVDVVETSAAIIGWDSRYFAGLNGDALKDPRVKLHHVELGAFLKQLRLGAAPDLPTEGYLLFLLDLDEGPATLSRPGNAGFYTDEGLERLEAPLRPGGVLGLWSSARDIDLMKRMQRRFQNVAEVVVPVELEDKMVMDYVYRARRHPPPQDPQRAN